MYTNEPIKTNHQQTQLGSHNPIYQTKQLKSSPNLKGQNPEASNLKPTKTQS